MRKFNITATLIPYHDKNERSQTEHLIQKIRAGISIALICDAGTPTISDQGFRIVRECKKNHIDVVPIPGPCALTAALSATGLPTHHFIFLGFPGHREGERMGVLKRYAAADATLIFYESCHRIGKFLSNIFDVYGPDRTVSVCKELTKIHEIILTAPIGEICKNIENLTVKGEFVVSIAPQNYNL